MKRAKLILITLVIMLATILLSTIEVNATLQANGKTSKRATTDAWISVFRNMEKQGEGMGLSETINADLTAKSASNNIDVHMAKSTEFGAMLILTASAYGNPSNEPNISTSTGNNTGVRFSYENENVAATTSNSFLNSFNGKYWDGYANTGSLEYVHRGDAVGTKTAANPGCNLWHNSKNNGLSQHILRGGRVGGVFTVTNYNGTNTSGVSMFYSNARGVAVCGEGL